MRQVSALSSVMSACELSPLDNVRLVAGVDVSLKRNRALAAATVLTFPELEIVLGKFRDFIGMIQQSRGGVVDEADVGVMRRADRVWYRRTFRVPEPWKARRLLLHFQAVDWEATVYVNGQELGTHRGGYDAFSYDITDALLASGEQELEGDDLRTGHDPVRRGAPVRAHARARAARPGPDRSSVFRPDPRDHPQHS